MGSENIRERFNILIKEIRDSPEYANAKIKIERSEKRYAMWKKVLAIGGAILAAIVGVLIGRGLPNRRRVSGTTDNLHELGESIGRAGDHNSDATDAVDDSSRLAGEIADRNRDNKSDVKRAKEILANAKARSGRVGRTRKPG